MAINHQELKTEVPPARQIPVGFIPVPTREYREHRKTVTSTLEPGAPRVAPLTPLARDLLVPSIGSRVLQWKQDPSVQEIGVRRAFLPGVILDGPRDARIRIEGLPTVHKNSLGDFIEVPNTPAFDAVHTYCVVRQTLTLYQRAMGGTNLPWQWNSGSDVTPLQVYPHYGEGLNAFYSRSGRRLAFLHQTAKSPVVYACRSLDIVAHETGHAILDALKPAWIQMANPPQTGGLHESFGDLTSIFLALAQYDQVEAIVAQTKSNLHNKTFLADLAEQFGLALGRPNGLRNADNNLKLSDVGNEVHAISQVFTGAVYDILADFFAYERKPFLRDDASVLQEVGQYVASLVLRAMMWAPDTAATFADVANRMLEIVATDGKPSIYRAFIRHHFTVREVTTSPLPLDAELPAGQMLEVGVRDVANVRQNRSTCCGTMQLDEYTGAEQAMAEEEENLKAAFRKGLHKEQPPRARA